MAASRVPSSHSSAQTPPVRSFSWMHLSLGLCVLSLCAGMVALISARSGSGPHAELASGAFGTAQNASGGTKVLNGVAGETFAPGARRVAAVEIETLAEDPNIAPVAWDRLSAGDCISVTAQSGQTLSFRIVGARPTGPAPEAGGSPKIDLVVTTCADKGEPVTKASIQPTTPPEPKAPRAERSL